MADSSEAQELQKETTVRVIYSIFQRNVLDQTEILVFPFADRVWPQWRQFVKVLYFVLVDKRFFVIPSGHTC